MLIWKIVGSDCDSVCNKNVVACELGDVLWHVKQLYETARGYFNIPMLDRGPCFHLIQCVRSCMAPILKNTRCSSISSTSWSISKFYLSKWMINLGVPPFQEASIFFQYFLRYLSVHGWWFGTCFSIYPYIGFLIIPSDFHMKRGVAQPPTR